MAQSDRQPKPEIAAAPEPGERFALYFAPPANSPWWRFGSRWLGRDALTEAAIDQPVVAGLPPGRLAAITHDAAGYGFHATLKPPFALADGANVSNLRQAIRRFCDRRSPIVLPAPRIVALGGFLALGLAAPVGAMDELAGDTVRFFDAFRAPPSQAELAKRRAAGLTPRQEALLQRWGYPHVMEEWIFHMTLTCRLADEEREMVDAALADLVTPLAGEPLIVDGLCLFHQPRRTAPFRLVERFAFAAADSG